MKQYRSFYLALWDATSLTAGFVLLLHAFATATGVTVGEVLQKLVEMPSMLWTESARDPATARIIVLCGLVLVAGALGGIGLLYERYRERGVSGIFLRKKSTV